jgi:hypothetical protein
MTAMGWEAPGQPQPHSRLSEAEMGATLLSSRQGRWLVIALLLVIGAFVACWFAAPKLLTVAVIPVVVIASLYLYRRHSTLYLSYCWWVWMLASFVRRIIEVKTGFVAESPILLLPYLVTLPTALTLLKHVPKLTRRHLVPFALTFSALLYGFVVGLVTNGPAAASFGLLVWMAPVLFGFHLAVQGDIYPAVRTVMKRTIVASVLLMGVYGIYQFLAGPKWDLFWISSTHMVTAGLPYAMQFRVFSTLNSPPPFAVVMMGAMIVVLSQRTKIGWLALSTGATALLLSTVRTAWLSFAIGFLLYAWFVPWRSISRLVIPVVFLTALVSVVISFTPLGDVIVTRFATFTSLHDDTSFRERRDFYASMAERVSRAPAGEGMGGTGVAATMSEGTAIRHFDSGVLDIAFSLGWFGGLAYVFGLVGLTLFALRIREARRDHFDLALRAAALAALSTLLSYNAAVGVSGLVFWGFLGLSIARHYWLIDFTEEQKRRTRHEMFAAAAASMAGAA